MEPTRTRRRWRIGAGNDPDDGDGPAAPSAWQRLVWLAAARLVLVWERVIPPLWPAGTIAGAFFALALFDVLPLLPGWAHLAVLVAVGLAVAIALGRALPAIARWPSVAAARRRLERDSGLADRPLTALADRFAGDPRDPLQVALWRRHRRRMAAAVKRLRLRLPTTDLPARDPWAVRALVLLVLVVAAVGSRGEWSARLAAALDPRLPAVAAAGRASLDIWLSPPAHTGQAPLFLARADAAAPPAGSPGAGARTRAVPEGTAVLARLGTRDGAPVPVLTIGSDDRAFTRIDAHHFRAEGRLDTPGRARVAVRLGAATLGQWQITVSADRPPEIALAEPPTETPRHALRLDFTARDDHGVVAARAVVGPGPATPHHARDRAPVAWPLPVDAETAREVAATHYHDLTALPLAGLPVLLHLEAEDGKGQVGRSAPVELVLPTRRFGHPVAREIAALRQALLIAGPDARRDVAGGLATLATAPDRYHGDVVVHLALRVAMRRLVRLADHAPGHGDAGAAPGAAAASLGAADLAVAALLWETALRLEDGGVSLAERELAAAREALAEALAAGADDAELARRIDALQDALARYLEALETELAERLAHGEAIPALPPEVADQVLGREDFADMMARLRDLTELGARDAAQEMLSELERMLQSLRTGIDPGEMAALQEGAELMRDLESLIDRQQTLLDRSFAAARRGAAAEPPDDPVALERRPPSRRDDAPPPPEAADQSALRLDLGEVMRRFGDVTGEIPRPLGQAELAMRGAEQALRDGRPDEAVVPQAAAVDGLKRALGALADAMQAQGGGFGLPQAGLPGRAGARPGAGRDPLGRPRGATGPVGDGDIVVPDAAEVKRAREILRELRRRAGEADRPARERDYIDRLLRRF